MEYRIKLILSIVLFCGQALLVLMNAPYLEQLDIADLLLIVGYFLCCILSIAAIYSLVRFKGMRVRIVWIAGIAALLLSLIDMGTQMQHAIHKESSNMIGSFLYMRYEPAIIMLKSGKIAFGISIMYQAFGQFLVALGLLLASLFTRSIKEPGKSS